MSATHRSIWLVLLAATFLVGMSLPHGANTAAIASPVEDLCCDDEVLACSPSATPDTGEQPIEEDCCPGGCTECGLMCCGGVVSVLPMLITVDAAQCSRGPLPPYGCDFSSVDRSRIYHPPRG